MTGNRNINKIFILLFFSFLNYAWGENSFVLTETSVYLSSSSVLPVSDDITAFYRYEEIPPFIQFTYKAELDYFYFSGSIPIRKSYNSDSKTTDNIPAGPCEIDTTFPYRGKIGFKNSIFNIELARGVPEIGPGRLSSTEFNKQIPYIDYAEAGLKYKNFSLKEYYITMDPILLNDEERIRQDSLAALNTVEPGSYDNRIKSAVYHQFSWSFNKLDISFGEFIIIGGNPVTTADLNPLLIYHNFYNEDSSNCFAFFNIVKSFGNTDIYIDFTIDDIKAFTENCSESGNVFAALTGIDYKNTFFRTTLEAVFVSTKFGLRTKPLQSPYSRILYLDNTDTGNRIYADYPLYYYLGNDVLDIHLFADLFLESSDIKIYIRNYLKGVSAVTDDPAALVNEKWYYLSGSPETVSDIDISFLYRLKSFLDLESGINIVMENISSLKNRIFFIMSYRF